MAAASYISFDLYLNECSLQQADKQNKKPHIKDMFSYAKMGERSRKFESDAHFRVVFLDSKTNRHKNFNTPN